MHFLLQQHKLFVHFHQNLNFSHWREKKKHLMSNKYLTGNRIIQVLTLSLSLKKITYL